MSNPKDVAMNAFRAGWECAVEHAGGVVQHSWGMDLDWEKIKSACFTGYWEEACKIWEAQAEMEKQRISHRMETEKKPHVLPVPIGIPKELTQGSGFELE